MDVHREAEDATRNLTSVEYMSFVVFESFLFSFLDHCMYMYDVFFNDDDNKK